MRSARMFRLLVAGLVACGSAAAKGPAIVKHLDDKPLAALKEAIVNGEYPRTTSVLIVLDGTLAYESHFGAGSEELLNNTRSATKFLTTFVLGAAIADGAIPSEHALAFPYLADLKPLLGLIKTMAISSSRVPIARPAECCRFGIWRATAVARF